MLHEFSDIVLEDLPDKLPLKRCINNHIDFIPGANLPKKDAYISGYWKIGLVEDEHRTWKNNESKLVG